MPGHRLTTQPAAAFLPGHAPASDDAPIDTRAASLSYFFPAYDEAANVEGLITEALEVLPTLARHFEVICVDDGSTDGTGTIADRLARTHPGLVRVVHHRRNMGYGWAIRSGLAAARFPLICFTDGDRQFRVADVARLLQHMEVGVAGGADGPGVVAGYRIKRADSFVRLLYARVYRLCLRAFFGLRVRDPDCACKLFRREALEGVRVTSGGAFLSAELLIKIGVMGGRIDEVGVPHHPRTAGRASGADPRVVLRAVRDFWRLRLHLWADRQAALRQGRLILDGEPRGGAAESPGEPV